ncbi:MAG: hypothetical protein QOJ57_2396 [Thermoleophilaceae bacterium]|jgi:hypothetical protein|nr:hypothetical protein [Thermoleophilaceae bacterium]
MTTLSRTPRVMPGAIVSVDPLLPIPDVIVFQYNPETTTRTLQGRGSEGGENSRSEPQRLTGPPIETIKLDAEIDAADQLEISDPIAMGVGIHPQLASLEVLLYPKSPIVIANAIAAHLGTIEILPPEAPLTLLVWGAARVVPVRVNEFTIEEQAFDTLLNPIRAKVSLGLRVLSYVDLPATNPGYYIFLAHQILKELLGLEGTRQSAARGKEAVVSLLGTF